MMVVIDGPLYAVRVQRFTDGEPGEVSTLPGLAVTPERASKKVRDHVIGSLTTWIGERNLAYATGHSISVSGTPLGDRFGGLRISERCVARPCPWVGDGPDETEQAGEWTVLEVWIEKQEGIAT